MKVLYIIDSLKSGGKERRLVSLIEGLSDFQDVDIELVLLSDTIHYKEILKLDIKIHKLKRDIRKDIMIVSKFNKIVKSFKPDVIHCWDNLGAISFAPLCRIKGIPFINSMITAAPPKLNILSKRYVSNMLSYALSDVILSNSKAGLVSFRVPKSKGYFIHNGFNLNRLKIKQTELEIRDKFSISSDKVVGMTASFTDKKDHETFIKSALSILEEEEVTFVTIGDGPYLERTKKLVPKGKSKYFKFVGVQSDVESIVNIFDVGVLATYTEGISNAIMEYMAFEKPVVATDGGGTNELVIDNVTGFLVGVKDFESLGRKIKFLLSNPRDAKEMGKKGKKRIEEFFSIDKMVNRTYQLYIKKIKN